MKLLLSKDKTRFLIDDVTLEQGSNLQDHLTVTVPYLHALRRKFPHKFDHWDGKKRFVKDMQIPRGLWNEVYGFCKANDIPLEIYGLSHIMDNNFNFKEFKQFCLDLFKDHPVYTPYDYQIEAAAKIIKNKFNQSEIATSAGKTLIAYMIFKWLKSQGFKRQLIIVPRLILVDQLIEDFEEYSNGETFTYQEIMGGSSKLRKEVDFVVGTFQSLVKLPKVWYSEIDSLFVDEAHNANSSSIKKIILNMDSHLKIKYGMSGTINTAEREVFLNTQSYLGPLIQSITPKFLMDNGYATPVKIKAYRINYLPDEYKKLLQEIRIQKRDSAAEAFAMEKDIIRNNNVRFQFVVNKILESQNNSLVLFTDIKNGYGKRLYEYINYHSDKRVYYIDGGTKKQIRDYYRKVMEDGQNEFIYITVNDKTYKFYDYDDIKLSNGTIKAAFEIEEGDDIDDDFLINNGKLI